MKKNLIAIIALMVAILIIAVVAVVLNSNDNGNSGSINNNNEALAEDMEVTAGVEDSIFDDEAAAENEGGGGDSNVSGGNTDAVGGGSSQGSAVKPGGKMTYEAFHAMSPAKQREYMESYNDIDKFFKWYNSAKKQYEKDHPSIEVDGGPVELQ